MIIRPENWVFLGDSLTEGLGSSRISYVTELAWRIREAGSASKSELAVHEIRLRKVDPDDFNRFIRFNLAGYLNEDGQDSQQTIWLWNLACAGRTIESDFEWLPLLHNLRPERVVVFRGSLESIIRPAMLRDDSWPWWVPTGWRGYAAMDPRCYFSTTWWRKSKQVVIDALKQKVRLYLLQRLPGEPLMDLNTLMTHYTMLLTHLQELDARILVLGLLPVDDKCFPGSPYYFKCVNEQLHKMADNVGVEFFDWGESLKMEGHPAELFYRDGFHPNLAGAHALTNILRKHLLSN